LFNLGALLSAAEGEWIKAEDVTQLEQWIDEMQAVVPPMRAFILPAGSEAVCRCHVCRTICRRAERKMLEAQADETALKWINRLSDYLFVLARFVGYKNHENEAVWQQN
jgi:cob(I)alamin adenosyltransferase